jgi:uncharacterized membrane protein
MLNPLLLLFLPLALVPVILHLITLRRLKTVELSTYRFLMDSYVQQRRRLRLLEWLVMLLRFAFVALIVVTLARPVVQGVGFLGSGTGGRDVTLIIDTSPTMGLHSGGTTSLSRAVGAAEAVLQRLGAEDHVRIIAAGREPTLVAQGFATNAGRLHEALGQVRAGGASADLSAAIRQTAAARPRGARLVYVLSDTMRQPWSAVARQRAAAALDPGTPITVLNVGPADAVSNVGIIGDPPQALRAVRGLPVTLSATVVNTSDDPAETVLSLYLGDERVDQAPLMLAPGQRLTRPFHVTPRQAGPLRVRFAVTPDAFPDDDAFRFGLNVKDSIRVLLVSDPDGSRADRAETYVRAALEAPRHVRVGLRRSDEQIAAALSVERIAHDALDARRLEIADVVILADAPLNQERAKLLRRYVEDGGGLLILPGERAADSDAYNDHLLTGVLRLNAPRGDVDDEARARRIADRRTAHAVLAAFAGEDGAFESVRVFRHTPLAAAAVGDGDEASDEATPVASDRVPLRLSDRSPLLVDVPVGAGRVMVSSVPATPGWSTLPLKPEFVPLLIRSVAYLQRPPDVTAPAAVGTSQPATIRVTDRWPRAQVQAVTPDGRRHTVELHRSGRHRVGALLDTHAPGDYAFEVMPRHDDAPEQINLALAVNLEGGAASFVPASEADVVASLSPAAVTYLRGSPDDPLLVDQLAHRREVWRTLIWVVFAVIGLEFLISTLRPARDPAKKSVVSRRAGATGPALRAAPPSTARTRQAEEVAR